MEIYSNVFDIANYYLAKEPMSNKKLQKIVYYAYSWTLALLNNPEDAIDNKLFAHSFEGWVHGPVCPALYDRYRQFGWRDIPNDDVVAVELPSEVAEILDDVWSEYGAFSGNELESITHQEEPWAESRKGLGTFEPSNRKIKDETIFNFYNKMAE